MTELNTRMPLPLMPSKTSKFFGNYDFSVVPLSYAEQAEADSEKYRYITNTYNNIAPLGLIEGYIKRIDRGMIHKPNMSPDQYIMPQSKGLYQYDPERTQYSPPRTDEEKEKIKTYYELMRKLRGEPSTEEDLDHKMWRLHRNDT